MRHDRLWAEECFKLLQQRCVWNEIMLFDAYNPAGKVQFFVLGVLCLWTKEELEGLLLRIFPIFTPSAVVSS